MTDKLMSMMICLSAGNWQLVSKNKQMKSLMKMKGESESDLQFLVFDFMINSMYGIIVFYMMGAMIFFMVKIFLS